MTSRRHRSEVNWRKILEDFRSSYQLRSAWEIVLIELIANSIDAGATVVDVAIEATALKVIRVVDNGKGMSRSAFDQYHNLGSISKAKGSGIRGAVVGAQLFRNRRGAALTE